MVSKAVDGSFSSRVAPVRPPIRAAGGELEDAAALSL